VECYRPRSPEGKRLAVAITALDGVLLRLRSDPERKPATPVDDERRVVLRVGHELAQWGA
jgi:hypothetical protein